MSRWRARDNPGAGTAWARQSEGADGRWRACSTHGHISDSKPLCFGHLGSLGQHISRHLPPALYSGLCPMSPHQPGLPRPAFVYVHLLPYFSLAHLTLTLTTCLSSVSLQVPRGQGLGFVHCSSQHQTHEALGHHLLTTCCGRQTEQSVRERG